MATAGDVLVTGAAGFLGFHLCQRLLACGHRVLGLDNLSTGRGENLVALARVPGFAFVEHDVVAPLLPAIGPRRRFAQIYNLACAASPQHYQADATHTVMTCVLGARHVLELGRAHGARVLQASTSEVYGDPQVHPQPESYHGNVSTSGPRACYDEGKRCAETLFFDAYRAHRTDVRVARIFNTYGPAMAADDGRVVTSFIVQALTGAPLTIFGDGQQTRSFCYVDDLVAGLIALMATKMATPEAINLGNPAEITVRRLAEAVLALTGSRSPIVRRPLPVDDPRRRRPDIARARALLGWAPQVPLEAGLARTVAYFAGRERRRRTTA